MLIDTPTFSNMGIYHNHLPEFGWYSKHAILYIYIGIGKMNGSCIVVAKMGNSFLFIPVAVWLMLRYLGQIIFVSCSLVGKWLWVGRDPLHFVPSNHA